ncbi:MULTISPECIES: hypothetical protein [Nitrosopumilus]|uniref:Uncharacterized protein n=1 Tax=Nitrosopumilus piranensis TaxID=1582439 RepID=A0A0C5BWQ7_9ARCH|nr:MULTISPECIES: hypothetical protein [Nitrosopumilus]AJM92689.1 hypothetical protein NPIRD3C_1477 [Nitrosopumilus piranensis]KAF6244547.1 hypothetical protein C6989_09830 [Nitrosopumilus sp. b2]
MKAGIPMISIGGGMFLVGLIMFYSIELGQTEPILRLIKNIGTFVGLSGIGVTVAGVLLYLISRNQPPIQENFES